MRKQRKLTKEEVEAAIWEMDYVDRICILSVSIVKDKSRDPIGAVFGLVECAARIAADFPEDKRYRFAERLRSTADRCEAFPKFEEGVAS